jgi:hypothetical protein
MIEPVFCSQIKENTGGCVGQLPFLASIPDLAVEN